MVPRCFLCLVLSAPMPLVLFAQEPAPQVKAFPVAKIQTLDRPGVVNMDFSPFGMPNSSGFQVVYRIKGKNILAVNGVELESLIGPDGKNRAAEWNKNNQNKPADPAALIVQESGQVPQFTIPIPEGEFGKLDLYKLKGRARVLVGVESAKLTAEVWNNGTETKTEPGFILKLEQPGKGFPAFQPGAPGIPGLPGILNPDILAMGFMEGANEAPFTTLIVGGPFANVRTIREKRLKVRGVGQNEIQNKEMRLMIPRSEDAKRTFVIEYWKETRELQVPFQL